MQAFKVNFEEVIFVFQALNCRIKRESFHRYWNLPSLGTPVSWEDLPWSNTHCKHFVLIIQPRKVLDVAKSSLLEVKVTWSLSPHGIYGTQTIVTEHVCCTVYYLAFMIKRFYFLLNIKRCLNSSLQIFSTLLRKFPLGC